MIKLSVKPTFIYDSKQNIAKKKIPALCYPVMEEKKKKTNLFT